MATQFITTNITGIRLSEHFTLSEFLNLQRHPRNIPDQQQIINMVHLCTILEQLRTAVACPIIITSGFRSPQVNTQVGGVPGSQHLYGQAADIKPQDPTKFSVLLDSVKKTDFDQCLTGRGWLHISYHPFRDNRHQFIQDYYTY